MISREQFDAYNRAVANLSDGAQREVESMIASWLQTDEGRSASVAECCEYAKSVISGVVQVYDSAAASLAAEWYDKQAADASRGAVYHSRKTASELRHFHRRCDCKVVPGFEDDPDTELVEGVRPKELREPWREFKDIDDDCSLTGEKREALKRRALNLAAVDPASSAGYSLANLDLSGLFAGEIKKCRRRTLLNGKAMSIYRDRDTAVNSPRAR